MAGSLVACAIEAVKSDDEPMGDDETASSPQALGSDISVYVDGSLASPWRNWGWATTVALANTDAPLALKSTSQVKVTSTAAWGALALARTSGDLLVSDYDAVTFDVRAPSPVTVQLMIEPLAGGNPTARVDIPATTTWTTQTVKLSSLAGSFTKFGKLDWLVPQSARTFYVDNIKLVAKASAPAPVVDSGPVATADTGSPSAPPSASFPVSPLAVTKGSVVNLTYSGGSYALYVPTTYDATHKTPAPVLLWMHGCGGNAYGDAWVVSPGGTQRWLSVSVGGRDGGCWNTSTDAALALGALDDIAKRVNVDPRRVVVGGYSSGGDMAYRTAFMNASRFAGIVATNTSPFRDTGSTQLLLMTSAAWKFNIAHLAHTGDTTYPITKVRTEIEALKAAGFPVTLLERPGTHWDPDTASSGTSYDLRTFLLPYVDSGWVSP
ncbi:MAG: hypothetical protein JST00_21460 [Deltaproteobacteria bacterium]|nr:hypothetical protein [Deltaproteobacteria bacterium]